MKMDPLITLGAILKRARRRAKVTIEEAEQRTQIPASLILDYEQGRKQPSFQNLIALLKIYQLDMEKITTALEAAPQEFWDNF